MTAIELHDKLSADIVAANQAIAAMQADMDARLAEHANELAARDAQIAHLKGEIDAALALNAEASGKIDALTSANAALEAKIALKPAFDDVGGGAEPVADGGSAPEPKPAFTRAQIARMSPAEYTANRAEILKQLNEGKIR